MTCAQCKAGVGGSQTASVFAIQDSPITSAIVSPMPGDEIEGPTDEVTVKGYAWAGGGKGVIRVDVTADGGKNWVSADLKHVPQRWSREWAWTLWEATVPLSEDAGQPGSEVQLAVRAVDTQYNAQPDNVAPLWNLRGVLLLRAACSVVFSDVMPRLP